MHYVILFNFKIFFVHSRLALHLLTYLIHLFLLCVFSVSSILFFPFSPFNWYSNWKCISIYKWLNTAALITALKRLNKWKKYKCFFLKKLNDILNVWNGIYIINDIILHNCTLIPKWNALGFGDTKLSHVCNSHKLTHK